MTDPEVAVSQCPVGVGREGRGSRCLGKVSGGGWGGVVSAPVAEGVLVRYKSQPLLSVTVAPGALPGF